MASLLLALLYSTIYWLSLGFALAGIGYLLVACWAGWRFSRRDRALTGYAPPVTLLKPLCGLEPGLYENLRSFCMQDYPAYQIVFGLSDAQDPALPIVQRLVKEFPQHDLSIVVEPRCAGTNLKVSNLCNMMRVAKHDIVIVSDADMRVGPQYLHIVISPFADPTTGAVTCLYRGTPVSGLASLLGALFINEWFLPSVLVALSFETLQYCFGATMAVRTEALRAIGGFEGLAADLADDHLLGKRVAAAGYRVALAPYLVENIVLETDLGSLFRHELRWARTIKAVRPGGYQFSFVTYAIAMGLLFLVVSGGSLLGGAVFICACTARYLLHEVLKSRLGLDAACKPWHLPVRDIFCFLVWAGSFMGTRVQWKSHRFNLESDGHLIQEGKHSL